MPSLSRSCLSFVRLSGGWDRGTSELAISDWGLTRVSTDKAEASSLFGSRAWTADWLSYCVWIVTSENCSDWIRLLPVIPRHPQCSRKTSSCSGFGVEGAFKLNGCSYLSWLLGLLTLLGLLIEGVVCVCLQGGNLNLPRAAIRRSSKEYLANA